MTRNIKLTIEYDGTSYHGWQSQSNSITVQDIIISAIEKLTAEKCTLLGSSRTDTGVHAIAQIANFKTDSNIPAEKFSLALNSILPKDIVIRQSEEVDLNFHARYSSKGKKYKYLIFNSKFPSALLRDRAYNLKSKLDVDLMQKAANYFIGTHDFAGFCSTGSSVKTTVRTIHDINVKKLGEQIELEISGDGFLYNMVRIIAGTLVQVGLGKIKADEIPSIISSKDRKKAGKTAPAVGLYLVEVYY